MRIQDYDSVCNVKSPADIEAALRKRHGAGRNAFWLSHGTEPFPAINIMVKGYLAHVHYFPKERHPGFASIGRLPDLGPDGDTVFVMNSSDEPVEIMNDAVVVLSDALKVAQEFAISATMPKCIQWYEL
jgi:Immunity protein Imm1